MLVSIGMPLKRGGMSRVTPRQAVVHAFISVGHGSRRESPLSFTSAAQAIDLGQVADRLDQLILVRADETRDTVFDHLRHTASPQGDYRRAARKCFGQPGHTVRQTLSLWSREHHAPASDVSA
jgi:hypothetical protein